MTTPTAASLLDEKEVLEEFISCYRHFTALWDSSSPDYLSKKKKEPGYEELLKILRRLNGESSVQDVKRKINSLRCCYRREIKKIRQSYDGYEPRLWWFHLMDFLKPVLNIESSRRFKEEDNVNDSLDDEEDEGEEASMLIHSSVMSQTYRTSSSINLWQQFFRLYRSMPELWLVKSKCYRDRNLKAQSYQRLLEHMRLIDPKANIHTLKRKINNLRTSYRRELRKVLDNHENEDYTPTLWYFKELEFLYELETGELQLAGDMGGELETANVEETNKFERRNSLHFIDENQLEDDDDDVEEEAENQGEQEEAESEDDNMFTERYQTEDDVLGLEADPEPEPEPEISLRAKSQPRVQSNYTKSHQHQRPRVSEVDSLDKIREPRRRPNSSNREDHENDDNDEDDDYVERKRRRCQRREDQAEIECELIGKRMAAHFRNMRPDQRLFAERIISDVLVYGRMNLLSLEARFLPGIVDASDR